MRALALAAALAALPLSPAGAAPAAPLDAGAGPVITQHAGMLDGRPVTYTAEAGLIPIRDVATGEPHGRMFYVAFRLPPAAGKPRPVMFIWNGGPGADSTTLDFHVAGPKRLAGGALIDNPQSWLAAADLVFVDPIGTGFSRPAKAEYAEEFYGTVGDVASVTEFVRAWRLLHGAEDAPLFLAGESWGAGRAGSVGYALQKRGVRVSGVVMISGGSGLEDHRLPASQAEALRVADLAATARFHGKLGAGAGASPEATRAAAEAWARQTYAPALEDPARLSEAEKDAIAAKLAEFTGLPATRIDRKTLKITPRQYRTELLGAPPLDTFDMRRRAGQPEGGGAAAILGFLRHGLGYRTEAPYVGLEPIESGYAPTGKYPQGVGARWNYATAPMTPEQVNAAVAEAVRTGGGPPRLGPPLPSTEQLVALNPGVRVMVAAGQYDSLNSCAANAETEKRLSGPLAAAMTFRCYAGGHMFYRYDEPVRLAFSRDVAAFVRSASGGAP